MPGLLAQGLALSGTHCMPETAGNPLWSSTLHSWNGFPSTTITTTPHPGEQGSLLEGFFYKCEWNEEMTDSLVNCTLNSDF